MVAALSRISHAAELPTRSRPKDVGMSDYEFSMSLGVRHPDIDPAHITRELGLQPGHVWRKGEDRLDQAGTMLGGNHRASYWFCEIAQRPKFSGERIGTESELVRVLHMLRRSIVFMQDLHYGGGVTELFVTIYARGEFRIELLPEEAALLEPAGGCDDDGDQALPDNNHGNGVSMLTRVKRRKATPEEARREQQRRARVSAPTLRQFLPLPRRWEWS